jgi:hypothetical protein
MATQLGDVNSQDFNIPDPNISYNTTPPDNSNKPKRFNGWIIVIIFLVIIILLYNIISGL